MLSGLPNLEPTAALQRLARSALETSAAAMSTSLARAAGVIQALRDTKWDLFDHVAHLEDERQGEARDLLQTLRKALEADEYVEALEPDLEEAETTAIRLLAPRPNRTGVIERDGKVWKTVKRGKATITAENQKAELGALTAMLGEGDGRCRLVLGWTLEREESP
jgi:hypothetical protein